MELQKFTNPENLKLLWEILLDETFQHMTKEELYNANQFFNNEIKVFYNTQINNKNTSINLLTLNQMCLEKIILSYDYLKQSQQPQQQQPQQQQKQAYKAEDIQTERMSQFENQLTQKRQEFESAITLKKPPVPNFSDESRSEHIPINEMEALIAQTLAQRNFDISQITSNSNTKDASSWLKPAETSIKTEKQQDNTSAIKYIKIGRDQLPPLTNEIIDINEPARQDKRLSWADESKRADESKWTDESKRQDESNNSSSIFSKLKIKSSPPIHTDIQSETQMEILMQRIEKLENIVNKLIETTQYSNDANNYLTIFPS
jgi:hypothetical protein